MNQNARAALFVSIVGGALFLLAGASLAQPPALLTPLRTAVIKSNAGLCLKGATCHRDKAGVWIPKTKIGIVSVSIPEQADVDLYVDVEISTRPEMYQCNEVDADGCVFRMKYAGPGLFDYGAKTGSTYLGSNITNSNITFPSGYGIVITAGTPVYVHLDVINGSLIDLSIDQDIWVYYTPLP
ncbi:MAG: hypothetical protein IT386_06710 [Deltaproteobacteria bacterium]|nr:hypothetical protein [Deltaproteobacteria bacterium]